ncbi:DUF4259 domain-containing protein [Actinomadura sp. 9N407]|uniref:DUF4259 domain-containing protein n=1 Tax=Actinomadura sp. 9N407 TaxID=3375154 RepID=UPI00379A5A9A
MGTWGTGAFDNDNASDFAMTLDELPQEQRYSAIGAELEAAIHEEGPLYGEVAIAAAALVAAQCPNGEPCDEIYGPQKPLPRLPTELRLLALQAIDRVTGPDSYLPELWAEGSKDSEWRAGMHRLRTVLTAALEHPNQLPLAP